MARMQGFTGGLSGKMGSAVFRQNHGQTIVSQYQPKVANPNTIGQVDQRAKFKLVAQLGAILADYIAIPRVGNMSGRNSFARINNDVARIKIDSNLQPVAAEINMANIKLTEGSSPFNITSNIYVQDQGKYVYNFTGNGTLSVATRPARKRCQVVVLKGGVNEIDNYQPTVVAQSIIEFDSETNNYHANIDIPIQAGESHSYTALAYEIVEDESNAAWSYNNVVSSVESDKHIALIPFLSRSNFATATMSQTTGVTLQMGR